jgi:hypothetical protein
MTAGLLALLLAAPLTPADRFSAGDPAGALVLLREAGGATNTVYNRSLLLHADGRLPEAIVGYVQAGLEQPGSDVVRLNLLLALLAREPGVDDALAPLPLLRELPLQSVVLLALVLAAVGFVRRRRGDALATAARWGGSLLLLVLLARLAAGVLDDRGVARSAVELRSKPVPSSEGLVALPAGNLLRPLAFTPGWVQVQTGSGLVGWIESSAWLGLKEAI